MKNWWTNLWDGEDLSELIVIVALAIMGFYAMHLGKIDLVTFVLGVFARHIMGRKKNNSNASPAQP